MSGCRCLGPSQAVVNGRPSVSMIGGLLLPLFVSTLTRWPVSWSASGGGGPVRRGFPTGSLMPDGGCSSPRCSFLRGLNRRRRPFRLGQLSRDCSGLGVTSPSSHSISRSGKGSTATIGRSFYFSSLSRCSRMVRRNPVMARPLLCLDPPPPNGVDRFWARDSLSWGGGGTAGWSWLCINH